MLKQFYKNRYILNFIIFVSTAFLSAILNTLLIRNLAGDQLSIWVVAATITGIISVSYTGITLKNLGELVNKSSKDLRLKDTSNFIFKKSRKINILWYFFLIPLIFINQIFFYCAFMSILLYYNSKILAISQFYKRQSSVIFGTFLFYLLFIMSITIYKNFFGLSFIEVGCIHIFIYLLYILIICRLIPITPTISIKNLSTRFNLTFAFFITFGQLDIFLANLNLDGGERSTYSGAASYSRFGFAIFSFISFYALEKLIRQKFQLTSVLFKLFLSIYFIVALIGFFVNLINPSLAMLLFGANFSELFKILGLQIISYTPWFILYIPVQYLIVKGNKKLSLILVTVFLVEIVIGYLFGTSVYMILFLHFIFGNFVLLLVLNLFKNGEQKIPTYYFYLGTSAELIKVKKLIQLFQDATVINTCQHSVSYFDVIRSLNSKKTREIFVFGRNANPLGSVSSLPFWLAQRLFYSVAYFIRIKIEAARNKRSIFIIIHGDTISSLIGGILGYLFGFHVVHIEAGLRSHNFLNPFPEELIRRVNSLVSSYHFAPNEASLANLRKYDGKKFNSGGNTFIDSIDKKIINSSKRAIKQKYIVVHLHRQEFLQNTRLIHKTINGLKSLDSKFIIYVVIDSQSIKLKEIIDKKNEFHYFKVVQKFNDRNEFLRFCMNAEFIITDSGGLQEEAAILGIPTLIHRKYTEREDGLGKNAILSKYRCDLILTFSLTYKNYRFKENYLSISPSRNIYNRLLKIR